ncbi:MAG: protein-tyrosine phosphatase [Candidatus Endobugula sp.]|jgi:protein-tyrosine phosphatase
MAIAVNKPIRVLFVCLGNICRSPTAHALFQTHVNREGLSEKVKVDSAGTGGWHIGHPPDKRAQQTALAQGYDMSDLRSRVVAAKDFETFDYILGMDNENFKYLAMMKPVRYHGVLGLFLAEAGVIHSEEVPDPYYGDGQHFDRAMALIQNGVTGLLKRIKHDHKL